jgi:Tfp pilus assembly protein PilX
MKESGNITVLVLMVLAIMSLMAIASYEESTTEVYLAKNELAKSTSFYCAEAAIVEASNVLEATDISKLQEIETNYSGRSLSWMYIDSKITSIDATTVYWENVSDILTSMSQCSNSKYIAIQKTYSNGSVLRNESLDMNKTGDNVHEYQLIARSTDGGSVATIEIGYRRRF